jgi:ABC-type sugar transport system substrate-binding protein
MRRLFLLTALLIAVSAAMISTSAAADEAKDLKAAQATKDTNYRWYNGQWWYWMAKGKNWVVWTGDKWVPFNSAQANRGAMRSFSYQQQDNQEGTQRMFGRPLSSIPNNVQNTQIIGSYGFRSAGSKALGNY